MEFPVWMFLIVAIVLTLVIGRLGTVLKGVNFHLNQAGFIIFLLVQLISSMC